MKNLLIIILLFLSQYSIFAQKKDEIWTGDTQYGKLTFDFYFNRKSETIFPKKITFIPKSDDKSLDYAYYLFQKIYDKSLDSNIFKLTLPIKHFPRKSIPDSLELYNAVKKLEKVLIDFHAEDLEKYTFMGIPKMDTPPQPKILMQGETLNYHNAVIEKTKFDSKSTYYLHFQNRVKVNDFDKNTEGLESIWQPFTDSNISTAHSYFIIVEIGRAFNQLEVLKKVIDSKH